MSDHKKPLTALERKGLQKHGLPIGMPSQLSDCFRLGVAWALAQPEQEPVVCCGDYATCMKSCTPRGRWLAEQEPVAWTPGPNLFKDWCSQYFGPDSDDDYLAKAVFNLPPMAQRFANTTPPQRKPLTEMQREAVFAEADRLMRADSNLLWRIAILTLTEAAHGIKEKNT